VLTASGHPRPIAELDRNGKFPRCTQGTYAVPNLYQPSEINATSGSDGGGAAEISVISTNRTLTVAVRQEVASTSLSTRTASSGK
jgi:hypothetical protein